MGNCFGRPKAQVGPATTSSANPEKPADDQEEEEEDLEMIPKYNTFQDFFHSTDSPTIYEYRFVREIGTGAMSFVYLAQHTQSDEPYAVKVYSNSVLEKPTLGSEQPALDNVQHEIEIMSKFAPRYLLSMIELMNNPKTNSMILIFPFAGLGTLQSQVDSHSIDQPHLAIAFHQIGVGLQHLHSHNVVHRDLKPDNVLCFSHEYFVLSDFSVSTELEDPNVKLEDTKGSPAFMSPEEISGDPFLAKPADVWAYGVMVYQCVFGLLPFNLGSVEGQPIGMTILSVIQLLETEVLVIPKLTDDIDPLVVPLIKRCLDKEPLKRPTFDEIVKSEYFKAAWPIDEAMAEEDAEAANQGEGAEEA
jgi:serine/threonine protein kinase